MTSKKVVLTLGLHDGKDKQKALKVVSKISGIDSIAVNTKEGKLTVVGDVDPVYVVEKLRKSWKADIFFVGPAKEPESKKADEGKKDVGGGGGGGGGKSKESNDKMTYYPYMAYYPQTVTYHPQGNYPYYCEDNPTSCAVC